MGGLALAGTSLLQMKGVLLDEQVSILGLSMASNHYSIKTAPNSGQPTTVFYVFEKL